MNDGPTPPGVLIREHVLPAFHLSISQAARDLNIARQTLHRILAGEAAMTPDMAVRLERFCGIASGFWMDCQHQYERHRLDVVMADVLARIPARCLPKDVLEHMGVHHANR